MKLAIELHNLREQGNKPARAPALLGSLPLVPGARLGVGDARESTIMGPGQFATQCVTFRKRKVKLPHVLEIRLGKPTPIVFGETLRIGLLFLSAIALHRL